ncbi:hypothetical protein [Streptomyces sp. C1-2]|uniref:hypothetical protein n=1 Tax=Streptomyces sp. C1-2 TaxID=2720022 RepID=UPI001F0D5B65|nr:hypothetical protein [Streptomyces sp. C1-2]
MRLAASTTGPRAGVNAATGATRSSSRPRTATRQRRKARPEPRSWASLTVSNVSAATPMVVATRVRARSSAVKWMRFTERPVLPA